METARVLEERGDVLKGMQLLWDRCAPAETRVGAFRTSAASEAPLAGPAGATARAPRTQYAGRTEYAKTHIEGY